MVLHAADHDRTPPDETETRVLETAGQLFYDHGIQAVGMDAVRDAAGVSLKRLYRLFPAKDALVEATLRHREAGVADALARATADAPTPEARILAVFTMLGAWFAAPDYRGCAFINAFAELAPRSSGVGDAVRDHKQAWHALFAALVREAGRPPALADQLAILANGAMVTAAINGSAEPATQARAVAETLLDATG